MMSLSIVKKFFPNVKTITDATSNATIEVTKSDVEKSKIKKHNECAMAIACKRKFHLDGVIVSRRIAYLVKGNKARRFKVPESVSREVVSFDRGGGFEAGTYQLAKIPEKEKLGPRNRPQKIKTRQVKEPRKRHFTTNIRQVLAGEKQ